MYDRRQSNESAGFRNKLGPLGFVPGSGTQLGKDDRFVDWHHLCLGLSWPNHMAVGPVRHYLLIDGSKRGMHGGHVIAALGDHLPS